MAFTSPMALLVASCISSALLLCLVDTLDAAPFNSYGMDQRYWPDLIYSNSTFAKAYILASGVVNNVYIQDASDGALVSPGYGTRDDVWLYTDGIDNLVYQIPSRGLWHPNRMNPGWPNLVGVNYQTAIKTIQAEVLGAAVIYGPTGFARTADIRLNRVWLDVDANSSVAITPRVM